MDMVKTLALYVVLVPALESVVVPIIQHGGDLLALWLWLAMLTISITMMTVYPVLIAPLFNKV
jgi:STE24 endopeptidase